ncbi:MAG: threonine synthase [Oscillospiraceae bacterium]
MNYRSTRDNSVAVGSAHAIARGISPDGGLYLPEALPRLTLKDLEAMLDMDYRSRACRILEGFLTDFTPAEIRESVEGAYGDQWDNPKIAPLAHLSPHVYMLELWHGPTCAFKDVALQLLPRLLTKAAQKTAGGKTIDILVATSGDTGKAALEGFADVPGTSITVFYPQEGVSQVQKLQMTTQQGGNVQVCGVYGNFDDTQTAVKQIFTDPELKEALAVQNRMFSSANSINWGRLVPQIVYYISAYCEMVAAEEIELGGTINIAVPTGNFGNILAAYYAKEMGLPVHKLICASNLNKVLADFINTGIYDRRREFITTSSPSMDILISSNLERLLHALTGADDSAVRTMMHQLSTQGVYEVPQEVKETLRTEFFGGFCNEEDTAATIRDTFERYSYLMDTHTAVAYKVYRDYVTQTGDDTKTVIASTANPYKFAGSILSALTGKPAQEDEFAQLEELEQLTGVPIPEPIGGLSQKPVRFTKTCQREEIRAAARELLGI